jgi:hypothetical protein
MVVPSLMKNSPLSSTVIHKVFYFGSLEGRNIGRHEGFWNG